MASRQSLTGEMSNHRNRNTKLPNRAGNAHSAIFEITAKEDETIVDEGWYTCVAGNSLDMSFRSAWLTVGD